MDEVLLESPFQQKPPSNLPPPFPQNHESLLKESIDRFLHEFSKGIRDFSGFRSIFLRLLQSRADPPLEIVWFYAAVTFHGTDVSSENDPLSRISSAKDLFQHLSACSASSNGVKSIALLAPVLFKLHHSVVEFFSSVDKSLLEKNSKKSKKLVREIECLVEGILGYVSICNSSSRSYGEFGFSADLLPCFSELIRVWVVDRLEGQWDVREGLRVFFPLVDDEIRNVFWEGECGVGYLAGVVIVEAFLLRLCWKVRLGAAKSELERELRAWVVGSITGFCNRIFFEMLLRLLLEPSLPVSSLLSSEEESFLRKVMYDAVILVDYSFLNPISADELNDDHMKSLAMMWLISVHEAVQVARVNGDQNKAISYINAFSRSQLCSELIKWVAGQIGMEKSNIPTASTPQALLSKFQVPILASSNILMRNHPPPICIMPSSIGFIEVEVKRPIS